MSKWDKLNKEFDEALDSMTSEDWTSWYERFKQKQINQNKMKEKAEMTREELIALGWMKKPSDKMQEKPKKQLTAVEWFYNELKNLIRQSELTDMKPSEFDERELELIKQAKEMEKEQMIKFAKHCLDKSIDLDILMAYNQVEIEYTNQTFKSE